MVGLVPSFTCVLLNILMTQIQNFDASKNLDYNYSYQVEVPGLPFDNAGKFIVVSNI